MNPVDLNATSTKPHDSSDAGQLILVSKLFNAISSHDNRAAIQLAPKIHRLDDYTDPRYGETPLVAAALYDASVECMQILLPLSDPLRRGFQKNYGSRACSECFFDNETTFPAARLGRAPPHGG